MAPDDNDSPDVATPLIEKEHDENTCGSCLATEFRLINLKLEFEYPGLFAQSHFVGPTLFLVWRIFAVILTIAITCICIALDSNFTKRTEDKVKWPIYLTNWSLLALVLSALAELAVTIHLQKYRKDLITGSSGSQPMPWFLKICWVLYNVSTCNAFCITILFWSILYDSSRGLSGYHVTYVFAHIINSLYAFLNLVITRIPSRILHFHHPCKLALDYAIFSAIYQAAGGTNYEHNPAIYPGLDWNQPGRTFGVVVAVITLNMALHAVICLVAYIRDLVAFKFKAKFAKQSFKTEDSHELQQLP